MREKLTLWYSYAGELGRGSFKALYPSFAIIVALSHFGVKSKYLLWCLASAVYVGMIVSLISSTVIARYRKKHIIMTAEIISRLTLVAAAFVTSGTAFVVFMALGSAINVFSLPHLSGIYGVNFRSGVRGHAVGRLLSLMIGTAAVTGILAGLLMDMNTSYYRILLLVVSVLGIGCSWYANSHLPEVRASGHRAPGRTWKDYVHVFSKDLAFVYLEFTWFIVGICGLWLAPISVLRLKAIGFRDGQIMLATVVITWLTVVLTIGLWGRLIYRLNFGIYRIILSVLFATGITVFFNSQTLLFVCLGSFVWALALSGGEISWRLVTTLFTTPQRVPVYMSVHVFLCGVRGLVGPFLSLSLYETYGPQFVAWLSVGGYLLSILLFIPIVYVMKKRNV